MYNLIIFILVIFFLYRTYRYFNKLRLLKGLTNIIKNINYNIAIDIIRFCDCKYQIAQLNNNKYEIDKDDRNFMPCPILSFDPNIILYVENNKITNSVILY
jgi:hypothetical protein